MVRRSLGTCHLLIVLSVLPLTMTVPRVGSSSLSSRRRKVDLPEPEEPIRKTNSPLSISVDTSSRAGRELAGYSLVTCCSSITRGHGTSPTRETGVSRAVGRRPVPTERERFRRGPGTPVTQRGPSGVRPCDGCDERDAWSRSTRGHGLL